MFFHTSFARWVDALIARIVPPALEAHPYDYCLHFGVSFIGSILAWFILSLFFPKSSGRLRKGIAIILFLCIGVGKELIDSYFSMKDLGSDLLGITAAMYVISLMDRQDVKKV